MKITQHGTKQSIGQINTLVDYFEEANDLQKWNYMGLTVEIDPTVDYNNQNMLIRWFDVNEGFNDRLIVNSLSEFNIHFAKIEL
ncbi:MAG: hypothetical protein AUK44_05535 [Porphyromonadaceae bacterium CG2_30_38_12]|nr:MAG: hypothetical protein AUK44_05535 [Porphyromonadaceae bacterium CG2_30_38_12]